MSRRFEASTGDAPRGKVPLSVESSSNGIAPVMATIVARSTIAMRMLEKYQGIG